jgi:electron transport complex protein RnfB
MIVPVEELDALLPQTQCTRCGFAGCRPYAEAMARGDASIDRCAPGGHATVLALAERLGVPARGLDPAYGTEGPARVAVIDEERCIGCALCLPPCPVDAIVGTRRHMHTVLAELCTGCELCIAPCPVDCIALVPLELLGSARRPPTPERNRERYRRHGERVARHAAERDALLDARARAAHSP